LGCVRLQLYSELNVNFVTITTTHACAFYIDTTTLADGTYVLVPESESDQREAKANLTEIVEDLKASYCQEGKSWSITYYVQIYATYYSYLLVHLSCRS